MPTNRPTTFASHPIVKSLYPLRPSIAPIHRYRNINLFSIDYAFRPRLRIRLTPGGRTFPGKPWVFGDQDSHLVFRYSYLHGHLYAVHGRFPFRFDPHTTLSYHSPVNWRIRGFGFRLSPDHFRRKTTRPVSYYALFKWWLPLSQHPGCLRDFTSFIPLSLN